MMIEIGVTWNLCEAFKKNTCLAGLDRRIDFARLSPVSNRNLKNIVLLCIFLKLQRSAFC